MSNEVTGRKTLNMLFTVQDAARHLTESHQPISEYALLDLVDQEKLPICFKLDAELSGVTIVDPDGHEEIVSLPIPFRGLLRSMVPPSGNELDATLVQIVRADGILYVHKDGKLIKGHALPTEAVHGGYIRQGYKVTGFVDYHTIPVSDWLFHINDLAALVTDQEIKVVTVITEAPPAPEPTKSEGVSPDTPRHREQEQAILAKLAELGHNPKALQKNQPGRPGIPAACKRALAASSLFTGSTTFDKAWERLAGWKDIKYSD